MTALFPSRLARLALAVSALLLSTIGIAQEADPPAPAAPAYAWELVLAPYALHWHYDSEHKNVYLIGIEGHRPGNWFWGAAYFSNSFGQPSGYVYYGYQWDDVFDFRGVYAKLTAGVLYGYRGQYQDKVPFNQNGFSPAIIPGVGYRITAQDAVQVSVLGSAGLIFSYNRRF